MGVEAGAASCFAVFALAVAGERDQQQVVVAMVLT
jgi:hypothetical protein